MNRGSQNISVRATFNIIESDDGFAPGAMPINVTSRLHHKICSDRLVIWPQAKDEERWAIGHTFASLQEGKDVVGMKGGKDLS